MPLPPNNRRSLAERGHIVQHAGRLPLEVLLALRCSAKMRPEIDHENVGGPRLVEVRECVRQPCSASGRATSAKQEVSRSTPGMITSPPSIHQETQMER